MRCRIKLLAGIALVAGFFLMMLARPLSAQDNYEYDARGFSAHRETFNQFPWEHVDPMTGNLILTFTDFDLPGNAGFDLKISRTYNSKEYQWHPAGTGWTMHLGKVIRAPYYGQPPNNPTQTPIFEWSDGSHHECYWSSWPQCVTADYWTYNDSTRQLQLPNGLVYQFDFVPGGGSVTDMMQDHYVTSITDPYGNSVTVQYNSQVTGPGPGMSQVTQTLGAQTRTVMFTYDATGSLISASSLGRTWTYSQSAASSFRTLNTVTPPAGGAWNFTYSSDPQYASELTSVVVPTGGEVDYTYDTRAVTDPVASDTTIYSRVVKTRATAPARNVTAGTWTFSYSTSGGNSTAVAGPGGITTTYSYTGWPSLGGYLTDIQVQQGSQQPETIHQEWASKAFLGDDYTGIGVNAMLLSVRSVTRGSYNGQTTYTYSDSAVNDPLNDYGNPIEIDESGPITRTTSRSYCYSQYVKGLVCSDAVSEPGSITYASGFTYDQTTGFRKTATKYGVTTTYVPDAHGNLAQETDADGYVTTHKYSWGVVSEVNRPKTLIDREINADGTVAAETAGGRTTRYAYDLIGRVTQKIPPSSNAIVTSYDDGAGTVTTTRGSSQTVVTNDGFGRPLSAVNTVGVQTQTAYDEYGRVVSQTAPYDSTIAPPPATTTSYDALGRPLVRTAPDNSTITYAYSGLDVSITDQDTNTTVQHWAAAGDPTAARLAGVTDANQKTWTYVYNAVGSLKEVDAPDGAPARTWEYDSRNFLMKTTQPESKSVTFTYTNAGDVSTKIDQDGAQTTTYTYDGNHRVATEKVGDVVTKRFTYEPGTDNLQNMTTGLVGSTFTYDLAGRVKSRQDVIDSQAFLTQYEYDANDNLSILYYPSYRRIQYSYDSENRVTKVSDISASRDYATQITYHPSGMVASYVAGNGIATRLTYDPQRYWIRIIDSGPLQMTYPTYDLAGNIQAIHDGHAGDQTFGYDNLGRLTAAAGGYGSIAYAYDAHGNRQSSNGTTYTYDPQTMRLMSQGVVSFGYDNNGNLTSNGTATFTYTADNMLQTVTGAGNAVTAYVYDADNLRMKKLNPDSSVIYYFHGPDGGLLTEWANPNATGQAIRDYVYLGSRLLASVAR